MAAHDGIVVDGADQSSLATVMGATMIVDGDAGIQPKRRNQTFTVEHRVKENPDVTVFRPRAADREEPGPTVPEMPLHRLQVFAQAGLAMQRHRRVFVACQAVEEHQSLTLVEEAHVIGWKALADVSEDALAERDGFVEVAERTEHAGEVSGGRHGGRRSRSGEFLQDGKDGAEVGLRRRGIAGTCKEPLPGDQGAGGLDQVLRGFRCRLA